LLSTLHTNDAPSAVTRLIDMGVEPFLVASSVVFICAQRLMKRVCASCREKIDIPKETLDKLGYREKGKATFYKGKGWRTPEYKGIEKEDCESYQKHQA
ncbi:MAG: ATPase, T2SS/T4P/T4SS family, partial [Candidatus Aenigmatarchaeota archaeon]